jgi:hypothetical protein
MTLDRKQNMNEGENKICFIERKKEILGLTHF